MDFIKFLILFVITTCSALSYAQTEQNNFADNVNVSDRSASYFDEYDTSKFRLGVLNANFSPDAPKLSRVPSSYMSIKEKLNSTPSNLCEVVKSKRGLSFKDSSSYVLSALKKAGTISSNDKNYSLDSAHFFWETYLTYRDLVDITQPIRREGVFRFSKLPNAAIVMLEKGCNLNGIAAIYCDGRYYAPKFVDVTKLEYRLNDSSDKECKLGKGMRVIAEAKRFL